MQIRVLGVPQQGAKSRVETQIKLCIQLVTDDGDKAQWWSHLKLPEHMVAKDKLKRQIMLSTAPNGTRIANVAGLDSNNMPISPEKMLFLSARVICASDPSRKVVTCLGCIQRERKRSQRRKENRVKAEIEEEKRPADDEKSLAMEEQKVLLFNCSEVVDFSSGDTILPTRITCYCRHHNERLGFCIYFEMQDHTGETVASGMSPPIMITDDHKSNKVKAGRKRPRQQLDQSLFSNIAAAAAAAAATTTTAGPSSSKISTQTPPPPTPPAVERPQLQRLIPNEGPTFGGIEVTILGTNFRSGLTVMFGDVVASSTHFWSPNTLVCILPAVAEPGPVVVSFKEYPVVMDSQEVMLFTYYNENDRALMELALQVVGLKMTGKVEDAREIAMRIVQGGNQNQRSSEGTTGSANLERHIIQVLEVMDTMEDVQSSDVSIANAQGHTMLHLAAMLGFTKLTLALLDLGCSVDNTDRNGSTALHYASWFGHEDVTRVLLEEGEADPEIYDLQNKRPMHLAKDYSIRTLLLNHMPLDDRETSESSHREDSLSDIMSADVDTSYDEEGDNSEEEEDDDSDSVWIGSDSEEKTEWQQAYVSDSSTASSEPSTTISEGLRRRRRQQQQHTDESPQQQQVASIQYLQLDDEDSNSADEILDAQPVHEQDALSSSDDEIPSNKKSSNWMQRTLSHFQQPKHQRSTSQDSSFLQNLKNNIATKPSDLTMKNIADHLLQLPRPTTMIANMSILRLSPDAPKNTTATEEPEQTLAWYMALAYAMGVRNSQSPPSSSSYDSYYPKGLETMQDKKRRDQRLFSFWVPLLCCKCCFYMFVQCRSW
ncbi:hypothetical protein BDB00DRAFT_772863 [Zychaea mexicana]|uniref:uncharacterized protein n=1 Tax=Zychaea mexicana TaxID=64656 RepID=UPI0022FF3BF9|nr:uncharacterized protein BDB00DRAFT_772863 [Zychaea mexicana]KAI9488231.1 hypothetical protein BDB00DRAFT_772863 [Zychaea mexicana]